MNNKKGMTIVELLVSVILISLVLTFIMQLYLRARNAYVSNSMNTKYEISKGIIIDSVMSDFLKYELSSIDESDNKLIFYFNGTTEVTKTLEVIDSEDAYLIKYSGGSDTTITREYLKRDIEYSGISSKQVASNISNSIVEYRIMLLGTNGINYSINLYCSNNM